ncbi:hypothetical protein ONZ45_g10356 [Pleurotus djamor]|nr:hypothetical protein ONZ45_g10356 [Pleurotus djamor]
MDDMDMDIHFSWSDTVQAAFGSCLACLSLNKAPRDRHDDASVPSSSTSNVNVNAPLSPNHHHHNHHNHHNHHFRPLQSQSHSHSLEDDITADADALSLHSNPGRASHRQRQRQRHSKNLKARGPNNVGVGFLGWRLFGKRTPAIQLPLDDENETGEDGLRVSGSLGTRPTLSSSSSSSTSKPTSKPTSPLLPADTQTPHLSGPTQTSLKLDDLTPEQLLQRVLAAEAAVAEELRQKEERRRRRRERREVKRLAQAEALGLSLDQIHLGGFGGDGGDGDFEGFQGSGTNVPVHHSHPGCPQAYPHPHPHHQPSTPSESSLRSPSMLDSSSSDANGYGLSNRRNGRAANIDSVHRIMNEDEDGDEAADLDGGVYTARRVVSGGSSASASGGSDSISNSRSRTSASWLDTSYPCPYPRPHQQQQQPQPHPMPHLPHPGPNQHRLIDLPPLQPPQHKKRSKETRSSTTGTSDSQSQTSFSSLRSPVSATFSSTFPSHPDHPYHPYHPGISLPPTTTTSNMRLDGLDEDSDLILHHQLQVQMQPEAKMFPSTDLGLGNDVTVRAGHARRSSRSMSLGAGAGYGAFLANTE